MTIETKQRLPEKSSESGAKGTISRTTPYLVRIKERRLLSKAGSTKEVYHISLDIRDSGLYFKPGAAARIAPQNDPQLVQHYLDALNLSGEELLTDPRTQEQISTRDFFLKRVNLSKLTSKFLKAIDFPIQDTHLEPLDVIRQANKPLSLDIIAPFFCPLLPRFYSIASSFLVHPDEIHLLVSAISFMKNAEKRYGVASHFLCHLANEDTPIPLTIHPAPHFALPMDSSQPLIMVGPGTGVAPFRAFIQERLLHRASGKHWLFFGERNRACDFYYEEELRDWTQQGHLKLDVAFSRDQCKKIYIQDKLLENEKEVWNWLSDGAALYVCGDAKKMAKNIDATLHQIAEKEGALSTEGAKAFIKSLRKEKRYLMDVY